MSTRPFALILILILFDHSTFAANPAQNPGANPNAPAKVIPIPQKIIDKLKTRNKDKKDFYKKAIK